jgi:hypothetical protein
MCVFVGVCWFTPCQDLAAPPLIPVKLAELGWFVDPKGGRGVEEGGGDPEKTETL